MNTNNKQIIDQIKALQGKYEICHYRYHKKRNALLPMTYFRLNDCQDQIEPRGGFTTIFVKFPNGKKFHAESSCMRLDNFRNSLGTAIALKRIREKMDAFSIPANQDLKITKKI